MTWLFKTVRQLTVALTLPMVCMPLVAAQWAMAQEAPRATASLPANRVVLSDSIHPATRTASDLGRTEGNIAMDRMVLMLAGNASQEQTLQALLDNLQTKG